VALLSHPNRDIFVRGGVQCLAVLTTVSSSPYGIGFEMNHKLKDVAITKDTVTVTIVEQIVLNPGDTLALMFNGEIVPMNRKEWDALIAYRDWRSVDDPRGESQEAGEPIPTPSTRTLVYHACAERLRRIHLGLHRLLRWAVFRD